ncbi:hypothetical protein CM49_03445 [Paenibacillus sp. P1XP2]|nr:hypothetical protein CM49_03445 [Paenibacillus sp. P1XP2]
MLQSWDYSLFSWINNAAGSFPALDAIMRFLSEDAEYLFYLAVIVYCFTRRERTGEWSYRRLFPPSSLSGSAMFSAIYFTGIVRSSPITCIK